MKLLRMLALSTLLLSPVLAFAANTDDCPCADRSCCPAGCPLCQHAAR